jgi:hypothetical protein
MNNDLIKQWTQLSKKAQDSLQKMNALNTASLKQFTKLQMEMVSSCLEGGVEKAKSIGKAASLSDVLNMQSVLYKDLSEKVLKNAQSSVKIAIETKQAMSELIKEGLFTAPPAAVKTKAEKKRTAAKPASKPAVKKAVATKPAAQKTAAKVAAKKASVKKVAVKPAAVKKVVAKPIVKKAAVSRTTAAKPVTKSSAVKPVAKPVTKKSAATKATTKPPLRKIAASPATKKPTVEPVKKTSSGKPAANEKAPISAENLQMPAPAIIRAVKGDAKK